MMIQPTYLDHNHVSKTEVLKVPFSKKVRQYAEAVLCRVGFWLCSRLPYTWLLTIARGLGACAYKIAFSERQVALANLSLALGNSYTPYERSVIARKCFQSFARTTLETLSAERLSWNRLDRYMVFAPGALDLLAKLVAQKRGLIALTFHYGNWEWLSLAWGLAGYPATVVAQPIKNPKVETLFYSRRQQAGHHLVWRRRAALQLYKTLKRGGIIGLLVDLNSSIEEGGSFFNFFGLPVLTTRMVGFLALRTGSPIVCSVAYPQEDGRYRIEIGPEISYDPTASLEAEIDEITKCWLVHCEKVIRKHPEFWMWMYKRWKVRPVPEIGGYPFYSFYDPKVKASLAIAGL